MNLFITGGSRGIGRAIVLKFVAEGWNVAFTYVSNQAAADETVEAARTVNPSATVRAYLMDLHDQAGIEAVCEKVISDFEDIHAVVNNAAIIRDNAAALMSNEEWNEVIGCNLSAPFIVCRSFLMNMLSKRYGRFIHISSLSADGSSGQVNYAAAKAGLDGMSRTLAKEYARKGITSNIVAVGFVPSELTKNHMNEQLQKFWIEHCPAKRVGKAEEIAGMVHHLCTEAGSFINGEHIRIAGGFTYAP
jgi:3-oxoacyl-[acyl-carrier protein] reductase